MNRFLLRTPSILHLATLGLAFSCAALAGCGETGLCNSAELTAALAAAGPGDVISVGSCEVRGSFTVPAGVTLTGEGPTSRLIAEGGPAVRAIPGVQQTTITQLTISSAQATGLLAVGVGGLRVSNVQIDASTGSALRVESLTSATISDVTLTGPVTAELAATLPPTADPALTATHGLVIVASADVNLERVRVSGFARFGVLALQSTVRWVGGGASDTLAVGLMADGGAITLENVEFCRVFSGVRLFPAYGLVFTGGASSTTNGVTLCDNEGYGMLQNGGIASHIDLVGMNNREPAVWIQESDSFALSGTGSMLANNALAGIVVVNSTNVNVADAQISGSTLATRIVGAGGSIRVGDGLHLVVEDPTSVTLTNVTLTDNTRAGLLLDFLVGTPDAMDLSSVTVEGTGTAFGAIAQDAAGIVALGTWDRNIIRRGATIANDASIASRLDVVGAVVPMFLPPPTM